MRVLLVAPDQHGIDARPEVDLITSMHRVHLLQGIVSKQRLYNDVKTNDYDIIHFASHSTEETLALSGDDELSPEEISQIARLCKAQLLFFNSCISGRMADYSVRHGLQYAIHTNVELEDEESWKMPLAFYRFLKDQIKESCDSVNFVESFMAADTGDGVYGLSISHTLVLNSMTVLEDIKLELEKQNAKINTLQAKINTLQRQMYLMGAGFSMFAVAMFGTVIVYTIF